MSHSNRESATKAILYAFIANFCIAISKLFAAIYTSSGSMMAESIHSFADTSNQVLLFVGLKQSQREPDSEHPLGYGKASYFYSFVVAILLFSVGGLFSIYEGFHKFHSPEPIKAAWIALTVLGVAIVLECFSLWGCMREINKIRGDQSLSSWIKNTRSAELMVVLGEDWAAILGLVIAFVFVSISAVTGNPIYDAIGSIAIGVVLIVVSIFVGSKMKRLIMGRSAEPELTAMLEEFIAQDEAVEKVFNVITLQFGPDVMLTAKIKVKSGLDIDTAVKHINKMERSIKEKFPTIVWSFIEPDVTDD